MLPAEDTGGAGQHAIGSLAAEEPTARDDLCVELQRAAMATWASAGTPGRTRRRHTMAQAVLGEALRWSSAAVLGGRLERRVGHLAGIRDHLGER
jgi:hypothetical protein